MQKAVKTRYCPYCQCFRPDEGFKFILHPPSGSKRGQCSPCQQKRKLPRSVIDQMTKDEAAARAAVISDRRKREAEERKRNENT